MKIDSLEELNLGFHEDMHYKYLIEQLLKMLPNSKKLYIYVRRESEPFSIGNQELEYLYIKCCEFTDQSEFLKQLRKGKLSAIIITNGAKGFYEWRKGDEENKPITK